jgi:hypothetical protein
MVHGIILASSHKFWFCAEFMFEAEKISFIQNNQLRGGTELGL